MFRINRIALPFLLSSLFFISPLALADQKEQVTEYIVEYIRSHIDVEIKSFDNEWFAKAFSCKFVHAKPWHKNPDGSRESSSSYLLADEGGHYSMIGEPREDNGGADLVACLKDGFVMGTEADATMLMDLLESLYDHDVSSERRVVKTKDGWQLLADKFFDNFKGYIVKTDGAGKVTSIVYSLGIEA